jgi:hypothetical protein
MQIEHTYGWLNVQPTMSKTCVTIGLRVTVYERVRRGGGPILLFDDA